jgi:hypothetical protein
VAVNCSGPPLLLSALDHYRCSPYWSTMADAYRGPLLLLLVLDADPSWLLIALVRVHYTLLFALVFFSCYLPWTITAATFTGQPWWLSALVHNSSYLYQSTTAAFSTNPLLLLLPALVHHTRHGGGMVGSIEGDGALHHGDQLSSQLRELLISEVFCGLS